MRGIMIAWGTPVAGRERLALEEFASYMQYVTTLKAQGKIARFEVYAPLFGKFEKQSGSSVIEGTAKQIEDILNSDDFRARTNRVMTVTHGLRIELLEVGEDVLNRMKAYAASIQQLRI